MKRYSHYIIVGAIIVTSFATAGSTFAATEKNNLSRGIKNGHSQIQKNVQHPLIVGSVTAISGTTLTLQGRNGVTYTVDASNAKVVKDLWTTSQTTTLSDIKIGDIIGAFGTESGTSITATSLVEKNNQHANGVGVGLVTDKTIPRISGTITGINGNTFTMNSLARGKNASSTTFTIITNNSTEFIEDGKTVSMSNLTTGKTVVINGTIDRTNKTATATKVTIVIPHPHITGTIQTISGTVLTITDRNNTTYTVETSGATITKGPNKDGQKITLTDLSIGNVINVVGAETTSQTNINATIIRQIISK